MWLKNPEKIYCVWVKRTLATSTSEIRVQILIILDAGPPRDIKFFNLFFLNFKWQTANSSTYFFFFNYQDFLKLPILNLSISQVLSSVKSCTFQCFRTWNSHQYYHCLSIVSFIYKHCVSMRLHICSLKRPHTTILYLFPPKKTKRRIKTCSLYNSLLPQNLLGTNLLGLLENPKLHLTLFWLIL